LKVLLVLSVYRNPLIAFSKIFLIANACIGLSSHSNTASRAKPLHSIITHRVAKASREDLIIVALFPVDINPSHPNFTRGGALI